MSRPCAVCDNAYGTRYVCPVCQAINEKYGVEWVEQERFETEDGAELDQVVVTRRLPDLIDKPIKDECPEVETALALLSTGLSMRRIASNVGRSKSWVEYIYRTRVRGEQKTWKKSSPTRKRRTRGAK